MNLTSIPPVHHEFPAAVTESEAKVTDVVVTQAAGQVAVWVVVDATSGLLAMACHVLAMDREIATIFTDKIEEVTTGIQSTPWEVPVLLYTAICQTVAGQ